MKHTLFCILRYYDKYYCNTYGYRNMWYTKVEAKKKVDPGLGSTCRLGEKHDLWPGVRWPKQNIYIYIFFHVWVSYQNRVTALSRQQATVNTFISNLARHVLHSCSLRLEIPCLPARLREIRNRLACCLSQTITFYRPINLSPEWPNALFTAIFLVVSSSRSLVFHKEHPQSVGEGPGNAEPRNHNKGGMRSP